MKIEETEKKKGRTELQECEAGALWKKSLEYSLTQGLEYRIYADNEETFVLDIDVDDNNYKISYKILSEDFKQLYYGAETNMSHAEVFNTLVVSTLAYLIEIFYQKEEMTTLGPGISKLTSVKEAENYTKARPKIEVDFNNGKIFKINPELKEEVLKLIGEHNIKVSNQEDSAYQRLKTLDNLKHSHN